MKISALLSRISQIKNSSLFWRLNLNKQDKTNLDSLERLLKKYANNPEADISFNDFTENYPASNFSDEYLNSNSPIAAIFKDLKIEQTKRDAEKKRIEEEEAKKEAERNKGNVPYMLQRITSDIESLSQSEDPREISALTSQVEWLRSLNVSVEELQKEQDAVIDVIAPADNNSRALETKPSRPNSADEETLPILDKRQSSPSKSFAFDQNYFSAVKLLEDYYKAQIYYLGGPENPSSFFSVASRIIHGAWRRKNITAVAKTISAHDPSGTQICKKDLDSLLTDLKSNLIEVGNTINLNGELAKRIKIIQEGAKKSIINLSTLNQEITDARNSKKISLIS